MIGLKKVALKLWHPHCWSIESTRDHPHVTLITKGVYKLENEVRANFHLIAESYSDLRAFIEDIENYSDYAYDIFIIGRNDLEADIHARFPPDKTFYEKVLSLEFMPMSVAISNGYEYWNILVDEEKLKETLDSLAELDGVSVEILSITNLKSLDDDRYMDIIERISRNLSMKQKKVLIEAYRHGYFEWPRKMSVDELARHFGIAKSTCLHHLRTAEGKIIRVFLEELRDREPHLYDIKMNSKPFVC